MEKNLLMELVSKYTRKLFYITTNILNYTDSDNFLSSMCQLITVMIISIAYTDEIRITRFITDRDSHCLSLFQFLFSKNRMNVAQSLKFHDKNEEN